jgi:hypothetical protein
MDNELEKGMSVFTYPVEITAEDIKNECGFDVLKEYGANMRVFLNTVHSAVYEGGIYATGERDIKDRIIRTHKGTTESAIKRALLLQASYMNEEGNVGTESGITITSDGQKAVVSKGDLRAKTICIAAVDCLKACSCPILWAGE